MASSARIEELRKKFEENPRRYFAPLANEYRKAGDIEQAISICREYLPQQPGHMSGHIVYGQALYEARQFDEAKSVFETALTLDPENLIALRHLGDIALMVGDGDAARSWYKRVLEADPRNEEIQAQLARIDQSGAPTPVAGTEPPLGSTPGPSVPTPVAGSATVPPITLVPSLSSAPTVVIDPSKLPLPKSAETEGSPKPVPESLSTTPTAEIHLDAPKSLVEEPAAVDTTSVPRLELDSPVPGMLADQLPVGTGSLAGLETTSLTSEPVASAPAESTPAPFELDMPPSDALPTTAAAPAPAGPLADIALTAPAAPEPMIASANATTDSGPELLDLSLPAPAPVELPLAASAEANAETSTEASTPSAASAPASPSGAATPAPPAAPPNLEDLPLIADTVPEPAATSPASGPFVTETMAELYLQQGHRDEAVRVYRALLEQRPGDAALQAKIASLTGPPRDAGPTIREMLSVIAMRRPGVRADTHAGNGVAAVAEAEPVSSAAAEAVTPPVDVARVLGPDAIGSFFGNAAVPDADEAAARTLALAFTPENGRGGPSGIAGSPARVAANELSLDAVFSSQAAASPSNFSFDQFFSKNAAGDQGHGATESRADSPDDVAQFTSWLQGLKRK